MRILAISDIHNNVVCVGKLRAQEKNNFDVIAIAGDIGDHRAEEIFAILKTFGCPIVYIYGNWDGRLSRNKSFGKHCYFVDLEIVRIGSLYFTGFSFRGKGRRYPFRNADGMSDAGYARACATVLARRIAEIGVDPRNLVVMSHDKATRLSTWCPDLLLHLYGHRHTFDVRQKAETTYVNVSALDRMLAVIPKDGQASQYGTQANAGNYVVIKVSQQRKVTVECRLLRRELANW